MAILKVRKWGDPILKTRTQEVTEVTEDIRRLVQDMFETMQVENGVGLAANQVGIAKRLFVVQVSMPDGSVVKHALLNPRIVKRSKVKVTQEEGCLSFPCIFGPVERHQDIEIEGLSLEGVRTTLTGSGLVARAFQHELDHLDGMVFIERMNMVHRVMLNRQLRELARQTKTELTGRTLPSKL